jgi:hypothetical protein
MSLMGGDFYCHIKLILGRDADLAAIRSIAQC